VNINRGNKLKEKPLNINSYYSKVVGVTFEGRQDVIGLMDGSEQLRFRREPENEYDKNAVAVDALVTHVAPEPEWLTIGYIAKDKNKELAEVLTDGKYASIKVSDITGGGDKSFGVNVHIEHERIIKKHRSENAVLVKDFFGNEIFYNPVAHEYTNALGEVYLSGSAYASGEEFDSEFWAKNTVDRYNLPDEVKAQIIDMWNINGEASRSFGTAVHAAIELYGKYRGLAKVIDTDLKTKKRKMLDSKTEKNSALSKIPYLRDATLKFFNKERAEEKAVYEVLVVDHEHKRAGRIDRLVIKDNGTFEVRDMKTNFKLPKKERDGYQKQLSFYADIILANGGTLGDNPIMLHHWKDGEWVDVKLGKIDTL
tara:strand:- start:637 stop:1740 length:1104 start_codon:yes stop_codon:yes gene_type:complete